MVWDRRASWWCGNHVNGPLTNEAFMNQISITRSVLSMDEPLTETIFIYRITSCNMFVYIASYVTYIHVQQVFVLSVPDHWMTLPLMTQMLMLTSWRWGWWWQRGHWMVPICSYEGVKEPGVAYLQGGAPLVYKWSNQPFNYIVISTTTGSYPINNFT